MNFDSNFDSGIALPNPTRGRRRLSETEKRSNKITTNFTDSELAVVRGLAEQAELTVSDYLRTAAVQGDIRGHQKGLERDAVKALGIASGSLNVLSSKANGRGGCIGKDEKDEIIDLMLMLTEAMADIRATLYKN
jgi:hypothetical protein